MKSISCKEAVHYILKREERKLSLLERVRLWQHLAICSLCRIFFAQNKLINQTQQQRQEEQHSLSVEEKEEIIRNVLDQTKM